MTFRCEACGEEHSGLPLAYRMVQPDVDPREHDFAYLRDGELCKIGPANFILANLELPYEDDKFVFTSWVSLSDESFAHIDERWEADDREFDEPVFGWFASLLPTYEPPTWALKTRVHQRPVGERPWIELEPTDHPLAIEQRSGISAERVAALYHAFCG